MKILSIAFCLSLFSCFFQPENPVSDSLTSQEQKLYQLLNDYRESKGLKKIPLNEDLNTVAKAHCKDLMENNPFHGRCNLHSWSYKGEWSGCCYTNDHSKASCMWDKPKELTDYSGPGYEIAYWNSEGVTAERSLESWKKSHSHHELILNEGIWDEEWEAVGIGMYREYACIWFGNEAN